MTTPVAQGEKAYAVTVKAGDQDAYTAAGQRTEIGQNNGARQFGDGTGDRQQRQGEERWIAYQLRLPAGTVQAGWCALNQNKGAGTGNGPLSLYFENNRLKLMQSGSQAYGSTSIGSIWNAPADTVRNQWIKIMIHVKWSTGSDGFVELFGDLADGQGFRQLMPRKSGWTLKYGADGGPVTVGSRIGIYRAKTNADTTVHFDGFNVAANRADASLRAFGQSL